MLAQVRRAAAPLAAAPVLGCGRLHQQRQAVDIHDNGVHVQPAKAVEQELGLAARGAPRAQGWARLRWGGNEPAAWHLRVWHHVGIVARRHGSALARLALLARGVAPTACPNGAGPVRTDQAAPAPARPQRVCAGDGQLAVPDDWPHRGVAGVHHRQLAGALGARCSAGLSTAELAATE